MSVVEVLKPVVRPEGADSLIGVHSTQWDRTQDRLIRGHSYKDLAVVCLIPSRGGEFDYRFLNAFDSLLKPPNHPFFMWRLVGMEVGDAFNRGIQTILDNPGLMALNNGTGPIVFTCEDDNIVSPDTLVKLLATFKSSPYAAVSALYFTKGEGGVAQIWGKPGDYPPNFAPQVPVIDTVQECRGTGMGAAVWDIGLFLDPRNQQGKAPDGTPIWFKTWQEVVPGVGAKVSTQDLSFWELAQRNGYRCAVDTSIRVGHLDKSSGVVW